MGQEVIHELKTWPRFFSAVACGSKTFEVRRDDREFAPGDILHLREWEPNSERYTGWEISAEVGFVISLRPIYDAVGMSIRVLGNEICPAQDAP